MDGYKIDINSHAISLIFGFAALPSYAASRSGCIDGRCTSGRAPSAHRCGRRREVMAARESRRLGSQHVELCCRLRPGRHVTRRLFSTRRCREKVGDGWYLPFFSIPLRSRRQRERREDCFVLARPTSAFSRSKVTIRGRISVFTSPGLCSKFSALDSNAKSV